jgi:ribosomal protein S18 acetylase RimI-like enzyme
MSEVTIRLARPEEYAAVGKITVEAYRTAEVLDGGDDYARVLADAASRAADSELLVAVDPNGVLLGTVTVVLPGTPYAELARDDELEFRMLAVDPRAQGRGVGEALSRAVIDRATELGLPAVVMSSGRRMTTAHRVYERLGFRRTPDRDWSPLPGVNLFAFRLDLRPPASELTIRPARPEEYAAVGELTVEAYRASGFLGEAERPDSYAHTLADAAGRAAAAELLVAVDAAGALLGTVTIAPPGTPYAQVSDDTELEFRMLAVAPAARGRGVGEALTRAVLDRATELGLRAVVLTTGREMAAAHRIYDRLGFHRTPDRDWSPRPGVDLITYRLLLP